MRRFGDFVLVEDRDSEPKDLLAKAKEIRARSEELANANDFSKGSTVAGGYAIKASQEDREGKGESYSSMKKKDLTAQGREHIKPHNFALPKEKAYSIHDMDHARNALARVAQHGTPEEKKAVRAAVHKKYPSLMKGLAGDGTLMMSYADRKAMEKNDPAVSGTTITDPNKGGEQGKRLKADDKGLNPQDSVRKEGWLKDTHSPTQTAPTTDVSGKSDPGTAPAAKVTASSGTEGQAGGTAHGKDDPGIRRGSFPTQSPGIGKGGRSPAPGDVKKSMRGPDALEWSPQDLQRGMAAYGGAMNTLGPNRSAEPLVKRERRQSRRGAADISLAQAIDMVDDGREF